MLREKKARDNTRFADWQIPEQVPYDASILQVKSETRFMTNESILVEGKNKIHS